MILIPFIENAFKFVVNPEKDSFIGINIMLEDILYVEGLDDYLKIFLTYHSINC